MGLTLGAYRTLEDNTQNNISALKVSDFNEVHSVYSFYREEPRGAVKTFCDYMHSKRYLQKRANTILTDESFQSVFTV